MDEEPPVKVLQTGVVDGVTQRSLVNYCKRQRLDLSSAMEQFLVIARTVGVHPIVLTDENAAISRLLGFEIAASGGSWIMVRSDGQYVDALSGRELALLDQVLDPLVKRTLPRAPLLGINPKAPGTMCFDVIVHHRATEELRVGALAELVFSMLGAPPPDLWGSTEPLTLPWDREAITMEARRGMPNTPVYRFSAPSVGTVGTLQYSRGASGLSEHLRGTVPIGPYNEAVDTAPDLSTNLLRTIHEAFTPVIATTTLFDDDPDGYQHIRSRRPEYPLGLLAGPWAIKEAQADIDEITTKHGGIRLGRPMVPVVLVPFNGDEAPWVQLSGVLRAVGVSNVAHGLGLDGSGRSGHVR